MLRPLDSAACPPPPGTVNIEEFLQGMDNLMQVSAPRPALSAWPMASIVPLTSLLTARWHTISSLFDHRSFVVSSPHPLNRWRRSRTQADPAKCAYLREFWETNTIKVGYAGTTWRRMENTIWLMNVGVTIITVGVIVRPTPHRSLHHPCSVLAPVLAARCSSNDRCSQRAAHPLPTRCFLLGLPMAALIEWLAACALLAATRDVAVAVGSVPCPTTADGMTVWAAGLRGGVLRLHPGPDDDGLSADLPARPAL